MHHSGWIDFMFVLIDLCAIFIVAGRLLYFQKEKGALEQGKIYLLNNKMGATPAGSDAWMATRAAAAVDH